MRWNSILCITSVLMLGLYGDNEQLKSELFDPEKDCISIENCGELGNAMFRSAFAICQCLDHGYSFLLNENYKNRYREVFSKFPIFTPKKPISNYHFINFVSSFGVKVSPNTTIGGFPHSYFYFNHHREEICELFKPSEQMLNYLYKKYSKILSNLDKHVGLHVRTFARGGDAGLMYLPKKDVTYLRCSFDYYDKAISHFPKDSVFVVFSDNIDCAKVLLKKYKREFIFIKNNSLEEDFYLLSLLKNVIITNSTFAWWAAYLNPSIEKEIVTPWPWHDYSSIGETWTLNGEHAICPREWNEYPIGDSFKDGFDNIIRKYLKNRK